MESEWKQREVQKNLLFIKQLPVSCLLFATSMDCIVHTYKYMASQVTLVVKKLPANADGGDMGSIPGSGRSPGVGDGTPLQYSPLENPMDRRAWWATVHGAARSWTRLSD